MIRTIINFNKFASMQKQIYQNSFEQLKKLSSTQRFAYLQNVMNLPQTNQPFVFPNQTYPEEQYIEARGIKHHFYIWQPEKSIAPKGLIFFMHGLGIHSGTSAYIAKHIVEKNKMIVIGYDFRNFGKSGGQQRGYVSSMHTLQQDAESVLGYVSQRFQPKKIFLAGFSMGGAIGFELCLKNKYSYDGIIFFAPALRMNPANSPWLVKIVRLIGRFFPLFKLMSRGNQNIVKHTSISNIPDPLQYNGKLIPGSYKTIMDYMDNVQKKYSKLTTPYLMLMGGCDKIVDVFLSIDLHQQSKAEDKTTIILKNMWHYIWKQDEILFLKDDIVDWLEKRL